MRKIEAQPTVLYQPKRPNPGQAEFLLNTLDPEKNVHLMVGGGGAGKSQGLVQAALEVAWIPGNVVAIFRKTQKDCLATTYTEFKKSVDPRFILAEDKSVHQLWLRTKDPDRPSRVDFRGLEDPADLGSSEYGHIFCDEMNQFTFTDFITMRQRLRLKLPAGVDLSGHAHKVWVPTKKTAAWCERYKIALDPDDRNQEWEWRMIRFLAGVTNPIPNPDHWLRRLYTTGNVNKKQFSVSVVRVSTDDNAKNLDDEYLAILDDQPEAERRRMRGGEDTPGVTGEPCTPSFVNLPIEEGGHVFSGPFPTYPINLTCGWDFGWGHPSWHAIEIKDGIAYVWAECLGEDITLDRFVRECIAPLEARFPAIGSMVNWLDHQAADQHSDKSKMTSRAILKGFGYRTKSRFSRPAQRADLVDDLIRTGRFYIHESCEKTRLALSGYWHRDEEDEPLKDGYWDNIGDSLGIPLICEFGSSVLNVKESGEDRRSRREQPVKPARDHGMPARRRVPTGRFALPGMRRVG